MEHECCDHDCEEEKVSVYFCPQCKSTDIKFVFEFSNLFGVIPRKRCLACGHEGMFPLLETTKGALHKQQQKKTRKKRGKKR